MLNTEHIPSPARAGKSGPMSGREWYPTTVRAILKSPVYIGEFCSAGITVSLPELALIDRVTFQKAQDQFSTNRALAARNCKHEYLLSSHFRCSCGHALSGTVASSGGITRYYRCSTKGDHGSVAQAELCKERTVRADAVEDPVWDWLFGLMGNKEALLHGLRRRR